MTNEISTLQIRIETTETYISNMSNTQASLIHQMAAKPEVASPSENNPAETLKTMSTSVATIGVFEEVKTFSTHEYPNTFKHVYVKINENIRMLAQIRARREREEAKIAEKLLKVSQLEFVPSNHLKK